MCNITSADLTIRDIELSLPC